MHTVRFLSLLVFLLSASPVSPLPCQQVGTQQPEIAPSRATGQAAAPKPEKKPATIDINKGPGAIWIWGKKPAGGNDSFIFHRSFQANCNSAHLVASCDNLMVIKINGRKVASHGSWETPVRIDVQKFLVAGKNELVVEGANAGGPAGMILKLAMKPRMVSRNTNKRTAVIAPNPVKRTAGLFCMSTATEKMPALTQTRSWATCA